MILQQAARGGGWRHGSGFIVDGSGVAPPRSGAPMPGALALTWWRPGQLDPTARWPDPATGGHRGGPVLLHLHPCLRVRVCLSAAGKEWHGCRSLHRAVGWRHRPVGTCDGGVAGSERAAVLQAATRMAALRVATRFARCECTLRCHHGPNATGMRCAEEQCGGHGMGERPNDASAGAASHAAVAQMAVAAARRVERRSAQDHRVV